MACLRKRVGVLAVVCAVAISMASGCGSSSAASGSSTSAGAAIIGTTCNRCHPIQRVQNARHDRAGWTATITRMRAHGARLTDQQAQAVVDYLTQRDGGS